MANDSFETLLAQANAAAQQSDWQGAVENLSRAAEIQPDVPGVLTALGTCLIQAEKPDQAVPHFERVAELLPDVFEAHNNLAVACTLAGQYARAEKALRRALEIDGENLAAWKNLAQVCLQQPEKVGEGVQILAALVKAHPEDAGALVMMANVYEEGGEPESAETLFAQAARLDPENAEAREGLGRVRARKERVARPEHAKKLAALRGLARAQPAAPPEKRVMAYQGASAYSALRLRAVCRQMGWGVEGMLLKSEFDPQDLEQASLCLFSQPQLSGELLRGLDACISAGVPFAVDLEQDYFHMLPDHPAYGHFGPGNEHGMKTLEMVLKAARWVSVPSPELAAQLGAYNQDVKVVLPVWDASNPMWARPPQARTAFHLGWIGSAGEREDLLSIKLDLTRFMRAFPRSVLVVAGDSGAFEAFGGLSEQRRFFLPGAGMEEMPYVLGQFDVLLAPWRDLPYNRAKSDLALVEAGARGLPWVGSPIPAYQEWGAGGLLAGQRGEWFRALSRLANEPELRRSLGAAGREKAEGRAVQE